MWVVVACGGCAKGDAAGTAGKTGAASKTDATGKQGATGKQDATTKADSAADAALREGYHKLCNAAELSGVAQSDNASKAIELAKWIEREVKSQPVLDLLNDLAVMNPSEKGPRLRAAAKAAGVEPCPLADAP